MHCSCIYLILLSLKIVPPSCNWIQYCIVIDLTLVSQVGKWSSAQSASGFMVEGWVKICFMVWSQSFLSFFLHSFFNYQTHGLFSWEYEKQMKKIILRSVVFDIGLNHNFFFLPFILFLLLFMGQLYFLVLLIGLTILF